MMMYIDLMAWYFGDVWFISAVSVENLYMHAKICFCWWCSVYFLNICFIRVFYCFNRNRALQWRWRKLLWLWSWSWSQSCPWSESLDGGFKCFNGWYDGLENVHLLRTCNFRSSTICLTHIAFKYLTQKNKNWKKKQGSSRWKF